MEETKKSILIVEDEQQQLQLLKTAFEREGYTVHTASDGVEGLEKAVATKPSIIVLDLVMPLGDGITMLYKINTTKELAGIPAVILTNLAMRDDVKKAMNLQKDTFFTKTDHTLKEIIDKVNASIA